MMLQFTDLPGCPLSSADLGMISGVTVGRWLPQCSLSALFSTCMTSQMTSKYIGKLLNVWTVSSMCNEMLTWFPVY